MAHDEGPLEPHLAALLGETRDGLDVSAARRAMGLPGRGPALPGAEEHLHEGGGREVVRRHKRPDGTAGEIVDVFRTGMAPPPPPPPPSRKAQGLEPHLKALLADAKDELALGQDPVAKAQAALRRKQGRGQ